MKNNGFVTRAISAVILVVLLLLAGIIGGYLLLAGTVFISFVGLYELYIVLGIYNKNFEDNKDNILAYGSFVCTTVFFVLIAVGGIMPKGVALDFGNWDSLLGSFSNFDNITNIMSMSYANLIFYFAIVSLVIFMGIYVFTFPRFSIEKVAFAYFGIIYVPIFMSFIYLVRGLVLGKYLFWLIFISSWICDTAAYLVGCSIGKHKLAPVLSPKKSIEGAIGGVAGSVLVAFLFGYLIEYKMFGGANNSVKYMIICAVGSVVSQIGDLAASGIKRNKDIKDYGNLIPGHGGILDRFDSVIFAAPFIYLMAQIVL